jgi:hypothetical protein
MNIPTPTPVSNTPVIKSHEVTNKRLKKNSTVKGKFKLSFIINDLFN